jgi:RNase P/RNase MRP subunit p29
MANSLSIQRGQSVRWTVTLRQPGTNQPINLTGATVEVLAHTMGNAVELEGEVTDAANGVFTLTMGRDATKNIRVRTHELRVRVNLPGGDALALPALAVVVT